jgi:hypothetical protein
MLEQFIIFAAKIFGSLAVAIVGCYILVRIGSIAFYRTKAEYDRSQHRRGLLNGESNGTKK